LWCCHLPGEIWTISKFSRQFAVLPSAGKNVNYFKSFDNTFLQCYHLWGEMLTIPTFWRVLTVLPSSGKNVNYFKNFTALPPSVKIWDIIVI
jgi:hypothetical protein